jgi:hypothetical protein
VPRYLFRAWSSSSGGGAGVCINSSTEIVPAAYLAGADQLFYRMPERDIWTMVEHHWYGKRTPLTSFSSWTASIHMVMCIAGEMNRSSEKDVHVAIIDTKKLNSCNNEPVRIWHVPDLLCYLGNGTDEFLAYGIIRGDGYKAVSFAKLVTRGLVDIIPEILQPSTHWGRYVRETDFNAEGRQGATMISHPDIRECVDLAKAFQPMYLPVALALICLHPQPWVRIEPDNLQKKKITMKQMDLILKRLGNPEVPSDWVGEDWINVDGKVNALYFPDVKQWIDLLHALAYAKNRRGARIAAMNQKLPRTSLGKRKQKPDECAHNKRHKVITE